MPDRPPGRDAAPAGNPERDTTVLDYGSAVTDAVVASRWVWGPYAATGVAAVVGRGAAVGGPPVVLAVAGAVFVLPPALLSHRPRPPEAVGYTAALAAVAAVWTWAVGRWAWPVAVVAAGVVACLAVARLLARRNAVVTVAAAAGCGAAVLAGLHRAGDAGRPVWWVVAGAVLATGSGVPRWAALVRARRSAAQAPAGPAVDTAPTVAALVRHGGRVIHPLPDTLTVAGGNWSVRLQLTGGQVLADIARVLPRAESELGLRAGALSVAGSDRRDHITLTCAPAVVEPLAGRAPGARPTSITQPLTLGVYQDGRPMRLRLFRNSGAASGMLAGRVGSGKSRTIWAQLAEITAVPDAVVLMADLSGGVTSGPWQSCLPLLLTDEASTGRLLVALVAVAEARSRTLVAQRREIWEPTPEHPAIVVYIDEAQKVLGYGASARAWEHMQAAEQAFQVLRKAGITIILSSPRPEQGQGISPAIRSQCTIRLCMAADESTTGYVFDGTPQRLAAMEICPTFDQERTPGQILGVGPGMETVPGLVTGYTYAEAEAIAVRHAAHRPRLDALSAAVFAQHDLPVAAALPPAATPAARTYAPPAVAPPTHAPPAALPPTHAAPAALPPGPPARTAPARVPPAVPARAEHATWTAADDHATWSLLDEIDRAAGAPLRIGDRTVILPAVDVPPVPPGRMTPEQALRVAAALVVRPGGTTPTQLRAATGYPESWSARLLAAWHDQGLLTRPERNRYVATPPGPTA